MRAFIPEILNKPAIIMTTIITSSIVHALESPIVVFMELKRIRSQTATLAPGSNSRFMGLLP